MPCSCWTRWPEWRWPTHPLTRRSTDRRSSSTTGCSAPPPAPCPALPICVRQDVRQPISILPNSICLMSRGGAQAMDYPENRTFIDRAVHHSGQASLRIGPGSGDGMAMQPLAVRQSFAPPARFSIRRGLASQRSWHTGDSARPRVRRSLGTGWRRSRFGPRQRASKRCSTTSRCGLWREAARSWRRQRGGRRARRAARCGCRMAAGCRGGAWR